LWQVLVEDNPKITKVSTALENSSRSIFDLINFWESNPMIDSFNMPAKRFYA
jgi:hypothetical protein